MFILFNPFFRYMYLRLFLKSRSEVLGHGNFMFGVWRSRKHEGGINIGAYSKITCVLKFTRISFIPCKQAERDGGIMQSWNFTFVSIQSNSRMS